jgi:hypothetical protein
VTNCLNYNLQYTVLYAGYDIWHKKQKYFCEQKERWNIWEEQQDTLGQITKQIHKLQRN